MMENKREKEIKVLALDLDGTLTNSEKKITEHTKQAVFAAVKQGVSIVLASGRPTIGILPLAKELELATHQGYILAYNGGRIIDMSTGKDIYHKMLPMEYFKDIYQIAKEHDLAMLTYDGDRIVSEHDEDPYVLRECFINKTKVHKADSLLEEIKAPVPKCLIVGDHEKLLPVRDYLQANYEGIFSVYFSEPYFLEVMPLGVEKSASLGILLEKLNASKNQLMACGDGLNDLTMLNFAGVGVAMENACKEAKEAADYITASNDEDGVAKAIEHFILSKEEKAV